MDKKSKLKECWIWNKSVEDFVKKRIKGYSLNVCSGKSSLGDVRIDLDPKDKSVVKGDMKKLSFKNSTFDCVISDPPWKINRFDRVKTFFELVRVCKIGGIIIYNATWIPTSKDIKLLETWVRQDVYFGEASIISVFEKVSEKGSKSDWNKREKELKKQKEK